MLQAKPIGDITFIGYKWSSFLCTQLSRQVPFKGELTWLSRFSMMRETNKTIFKTSILFSNKWTSSDLQTRFQP